jgi:hypothetical protein
MSVSLAIGSRSHAAPYPTDVAGSIWSDSSGSYPVRGTPPQSRPSKHAEIRGGEIETRSDSSLTFTTDC